MGVAMSTDASTQMEVAFASLPDEERKLIIFHGVALRLAELRKRLFLAESEVRCFQEKYGTTLASLELVGLPDDADYGMHEDYVRGKSYCGFSSVWQHWSYVVSRVRKETESLQEIAQHGVPWGGPNQHNPQASSETRLEHVAEFIGAYRH